jgi:hypothetical protein
MKIYVVIKVAQETSGSWCAATTEGAFKTPEAAQQWLNGKQIVWEEEVNGVLCYCERAVHESELA